MGQLNAQLGHAVDLRNALPGQEVQPVEVLPVSLDQHFGGGFGHRNDRLEQGALAVLDILAHRVQVGRQRDARREDALALLALALAVELFPPLVDILQFRLVGTQDFDLLASVVEDVAHGGVDGCRILLESDAFGRGLLHLLRTADESRDVHAGDGQRQQPHGGQHREASAHIVGNDERRVSLLRGERLQRPARLVGDGHDALRSLLLAVTLLDLGLYEAERDGRLGRRARLRNHDGGDRMLLQRGEQFGGVILRNVLSGENDRGVLLLLVQEFEGIAHGFEHGLGAEVRAADADADDHVGLRAQFRSLLPDGVDLVLRNRGGEVHPTQKIVAGAVARMQQGIGGLRFGLDVGGNFNARLGNVQFHIFHHIAN